MSGPSPDPSHAARSALMLQETGRHQYLAFVDGLRAVSILAVVAYHSGLPGFSGGYTGVDVFFVISGFLIINQIKDGLEANRFSILSFYARRGLRILPPYIVMLVIVFMAAPFVLPAPAVYNAFAFQAALSRLMLSNFLFHRAQGYFDLAATDKPFLHTWSLSIEEQFYLAVPLFLILIYPDSLKIQKIACHEPDLGFVCAT